MNVTQKVLLALVLYCFLGVFIQAVSQENSKHEYHGDPSVAYKTGNQLPGQDKVSASETTIQGKKIICKNNDFEAAMSCRLENQLYANINTNLLNKNIHDKLVLNKTVMDFSLYTKTLCAQSVVTARSKTIWGSHRTLYTDVAYLKNLGALETGHSHTMGANMPWVREVWVEFDITKACKMPDIGTHALTLGSFSFQLGRGIALGDIYRLDPSGITFYLDFTVDQYAWGAKLSGDIIQNQLKYDVYLSIDTDKSTSLAETNAPTQLQSFGTSDGIVRGAGVIGYILAGRFIFTPLKGTTNLSFEPYAMHYCAAEQNIEFLYDAKGSLITAGFAVEFTSSRFEWGFDCASNFGSQDIKAWDRNVVLPINNQGYEAFTYTEVFNVDPTVTTPTAADAVLFDPSNKTQTQAIRTTTPGEQYNGKNIAGTSFYNGLTRFRDHRSLGLRGYMWVGDVSFTLIPQSVVLAITGGIASGALSPYPNYDDPLAADPKSNFDGFVPLRELYFGKRVLSLFGLSNGVVRPLPVPSAEKQYADITDNLSNLIFWGMSVRYSLPKPKKKCTINPNMLLYWDDQQTNMFDQKTGKTTRIPADKYLGVEANLLFESFPSTNTYLVGGFGIFVPGQHYFEVQGKPISLESRLLLDAALAAGAPTKNLPLLGDASAYSIMMILGYLF